MTQDKLNKLIHDLKSYEGGLFDCYIDPKIKSLSDKPLIDFLLYRKSIPEIVEICKNNPIKEMVNHPMTDFPTEESSRQWFPVCREYTRYREKFSQKNVEYKQRNCGHTHPCFPSTRLDVSEGVEFEDISNLGYIIIKILEFEPLKIPIKSKQVKFPFPLIRKRMFCTACVFLYDKNEKQIEFNLVNSWLYGGVLIYYPFERMDEIKIPFEVSGKKYIAWYNYSIGIEATEPYYKPF